MDVLCGARCRYGSLDLQPPYAVGTDTLYVSKSFCMCTGMSAHHRGHVATIGVNSGMFAMCACWIRSRVAASICDSFTGEIFES